MVMTLSVLFIPSFCMEKVLKFDTELQPSEEYFALVVRYAEAIFEQQSDSFKGFWY